MTVPFDSHADPLHEWLEARAAGQVPPEVSDSDSDLADLIATADQLDHLARRYDEVVLHPRSFRHRSWEEQMTFTTPVPTYTTGLHQTPASPTKPDWRSRVQHWQAYASFGLVLAVILSLMAITYDRASAPPLGTTPSGQNSLPGLAQTDATPEESSTDCVAREVSWQKSETPPVRTPAPQYEAKEPASQDTGQLALTTYIGYWTCLISNQPEATHTQDAINTYLTGNFQPHAAGAFLQQQTAAEASTDGEYASREDEILHNAIIPVNQPAVYHHVPDETGIWGTSIKVFWPANVFELIDGRYGVVIGSVSTDTFRSGSTGEDPFDDGTLTWVAFEEQNGQLFIDEIRPFCTGEWSPDEESPSGGSAYPCS